MKLVRKKRRSLVRIFASCIPDFLWKFLLPVPPRMCISFNVMERILSLRQNNFHSEDGNFSHLKSQSTNKSESSSKVLYSTSLKTAEKKNSRIRELQLEIDEIHKQISKLMKNQCNQLQCSNYGALSKPIKQNVF